MTTKTKTCEAASSALLLVVMLDEEDEELVGIPTACGARVTEVEDGGRCSSS